MNSRERVRALIAGQPADRTAFWLGDPHHDTWPRLLAYFKQPDQEALRQHLHDDFRWIIAGRYTGLSNASPFDFRRDKKKSHGEAGPLAQIEDPAELDAFPWPDAQHIDFGDTLRYLEGLGPYYRASGMWTCFYHNIMDLFGMEDYMVKMLENPPVVQAVTDRVCQFYYDGNERFFREAGDLVDAFFFGNDFGTQLDLICGPAQFDEFILPWFQRFTEQGHRHGKQVILHSCGAIHKVIDRLIASKVDCLHPLQALARNMDAETLGRDFGGQITFLGGIDTQELLVNGTPNAIRADVRRVRRALGPRLIVSPSHEAILPDIPPENIAAMSEAASEKL